MKRGLKALFPKKAFFQSYIPLDEKRIERCIRTSFKLLIERRVSMKRGLKVQKLVHNALQLLNHLARGKEDGKNNLNSVYFYSGLSLLDEKRIERELRGIAIAGYDILTARGKEDGKETVTFVSDPAYHKLDEKRIERYYTQDAVCFDLTDISTLDEKRLKGFKIGISDHANSMARGKEDGKGTGIIHKDENNKLRNYGNEN